MGPLGPQPLWAQSKQLAFESGLSGDGEATSSLARVLGCLLNVCDPAGLSS